PTPHRVRPAGSSRSARLGPDPVPRGLDSVAVAVTRTRLCLTMIVKDEAAIIERCLSAAAPWIDAYAIHDTGSSDGTPDIVRSFFEERGVPGQVTHGRFHDFAQARN